MAIYCVGCNADIAAWTDSQHYIGSGEGAAGFIFCASCWDGVEDWWMNTAIDEAVWQIASACSGVTADGGNAAPIGEVITYHTGVTTYITER